MAAEGELRLDPASVAESTSSSSCATCGPTHDSSRRSSSGPPRTSSNAARSCLSASPGGSRGGVGELLEPLDVQLALSR